MFELLGFLAGALSLIGFFPQTIKTLRTRKTDDLSFSTFGLVATSALLWAVYGIVNQRPAIWVTNIIVATLNSIIVFIKLSNARK
jgi:MtN3 and saliva related transmembrane protein